MNKYQEALNDSIRKAQERIEYMCYKYKENEWYISFSGGKDSTVILALCKLCYELGSIPYLPRAVFSNTGLELQATIDFVNWCKEEWYTNIEIIRPEKSFVYCLDTYGKPILSKIKSQFLETWNRTKKEDKDVKNKSRLLLLLYGKSKEDNERKTSKFKLANRDLHILHSNFDIKVSDKCCYVLKKKPFEEYALNNGILGMADGEMASEGGIRASAYEKRIKNGGKPCTTIKEIGKGKEKRNIEKKMPIIDWSKEVEEEFIKQYNVPLSKAYTEYGCDRTGCFLCPFAKNRKDLTSRLKMLYDNEPKKYKYAMATMKDVYIAMNVKLPFDKGYEEERIYIWQTKYDPMRIEMMKKYRNDKCKCKNEQLSLF